MKYSKSLDKILDKYINLNTYGEIAPVLKHIFQKRASEFEFSDEEMENQIKVFCENCKKVTLGFSRRDRGSITAGFYSFAQKRIELNNHPTEHSELYEALTHEVYHAISPSCLKYFNIDTYKLHDGTALNEICTEKAATRASRKITPRNYLKTSGYSSITPIISLLANATGVPEKQLLKAGLQNREELMKVIYSKFPGEGYNEEVEKLFKKVETNLDIIYNNTYKDKNVDKNIRKQIIAAAFQGIEEGAFELAAYQMNSDEKLTPAEKAYRFKNMESIIEYAKKGMKIKETTKTQIAQDKMIEILGMNGVKAAVANPDKKYEKQRFQEEYGNKADWRDGKFTNKLSMMSIQSVLLSIFPEKYRNKVKTLMFKRSPKLLGSGEENSYQARKKNFIRDIKVEPEDLIPIEETQPNNEEIVHTKPEDSVKDDTGEPNI